MSIDFTKWSGFSGDLEFTHVLDVRSPSEFDLDHIPGALNYPVLSDAERAEVGTLYIAGEEGSAPKASL